MSSPVELLDAPVPPDPDRVKEPWFGDVELSLALDLSDWIALVDAPDGLTTDRAWRLLNWAEEAATQVVRRPRPGLVELAAVALSLLEGGPVDRREAQVVGILLRRACTLTGVEFTTAVRAGCARVGPRGEACLEWLWWSVADLPSTHVEVGQGSSFRFDRAPGPDIDIEALTRWAKGES